ncbi:unnamed protein product [Periconia digitata]|uniref:EKC/KEOPS complex subunit BUD32 n=1 Tax=Periconia digitata TaxID=1303443 RepID=A0A9W4XMG4_9PLEO|nr:unnamed protein product [Periconia digitata]
MEKSVLQLSPTFWDSEAACYAMRIGSSGHEFLMMWKTSKWQPDLSAFPTLDERVTLKEVTHSPEKEAVWKQSCFRSFGSHGVVRENTEPAPFPVIKLAHDTPVSKRLISKEFEILSEMSSQSLPVVKVDKQPLEDQQGIFEYSMEKLVAIEPAKIGSYIADIETGLSQLHHHGIVHGDISPSNVMLNSMRQIRFIDLSHAGKLHQPLDDFHRHLAEFRGWNSFEIAIDLVKLADIKKTFSTHN